MSIGIRLLNQAQYNPVNRVTVFTDLFEWIAFNALAVDALLINADRSTYFNY